MCVLYRRSVMKSFAIFAALFAVVLFSSLSADAACSRRGCRGKLLKGQPVRGALAHLRADRCCR